MMQTQPTWTSLEVVKLIVSALTPLMILVFGIWVTRLSERFKASLWVNQKVIEKRITVYDELAPLLNDLYCYYYFVGNWKETSPSQIIEAKRNLDRKVYIYAPLFSPEFVKCYDEFIDLCFKTHQEGSTAKLRTSLGDNEDRKKFLPSKWDAAWDSMFTGEGRPHAHEIRQAYRKLMTRFSLELGIVLK